MCRDSPIRSLNYCSHPEPLSSGFCPDCEQYTKLAKVFIKELKMAKKVSKKVSRKHVERDEYADDDQPVVEVVAKAKKPSVKLDAMDSRVAGLLQAVDQMRGVALDDMHNRFHVKVAKQSVAVEKLALALETAIAVAEKKRQQQRELRDRLLARAAKHDV